MPYDLHGGVRASVHSQHEANFAVPAQETRNLIPVQSEVRDTYESLLVIEVLNIVRWG